MGVFDVVNFIRAQVVNFWLAPKFQANDVVALQHRSSFVAADEHRLGLRNSGILDHDSHAATPKVNSLRTIDFSLFSPQKSPQKSMRASRSTVEGAVLGRKLYRGPAVGLA
jgi:hypothetical protein